MLKIPELNLGFRDAENYKRKENRELFNKIFIRTESLEKLLDPNIFFLIGEKGTGKTAYGVYLSNNEYREHSGSIRYISQTEYQKFLTLKKEKHLQFSDYTSIWKVILSLLLSQQIKEHQEDFDYFEKFLKFKALQSAIDEFYHRAFSPEIIYAINFVEDSKKAAELISHFAIADAHLGIESKKEIAFSEQKFQMNLMYIQKKFDEALLSLKLKKKNYILFIDGVDVRPSSIPYDEYIECIKGLANAVWSINNDLLSSMRGRGKMRVILLLRPDIFNTLGLQNQNNKLRDNAEILDWRTPYRDYRTSNLFELADNLLRFQQKETLDLGEAWDYYFPYNAENVRTMQLKNTAFIDFLRFSLYRPRDTNTILKILQDHFVRKGKDPISVFSRDDFFDNHVRREISNYFVGEIKDQMSFYYSAKDFEIFLKFFSFLKGSSDFDYDQYLITYNNFIRFLGENHFDVPQFCITPEIFLQFLYDLNIICYFDRSLDDEKFIRWCFMERSYANISPKVETHKYYRIHQGMRKAFNLGKLLR